VTQYAVSKLLGDNTNIWELRCIGSLLRLCERHQRCNPVKCHVWIILNLQSCFRYSFWSHQKDNHKRKLSHPCDPQSQVIHKSQYIIKRGSEYNDEEVMAILHLVLLRMAAGDAGRGTRGRHWGRTAGHPCHSQQSRPLPQVPWACWPPLDLSCRR